MKPVCRENAIGVSTILLAAALIVNVAMQAQTTGLDRFVGVDLWKQRPTKTDLAYLTKVVGKIPKGHLTEPDPWRVWKTQHRGESRYVVLLGEDLGLVPGGTTASIQLFSARAEKIRGWSFQAGWRNRLLDASIEFSEHLAADVMVLRVAPVVNGRNIANEYFSIGDDQLRLVRIENDTGEIVQNEYVVPNYEIGLVPEVKTVSAWTRLLASQDKADVLSALTFLGVRHIREANRQFDGEPQASNYAAVFEELLRDSRIRELIEQLRNSPNKWIREAATLASRGARERSLD